jgi:hypothetical protein
MSCEGSRLILNTPAWSNHAGVGRVNLWEQLEGLKSLYLGKIFGHDSEAFFARPLGKPPVINRISAGSSGALAET